MSPAHPRCTHRLAKYHPFHMDSKYIFLFVSLAILHENIVSLNERLTCKPYSMATVHLQDTRMTASEGALAIMGLHRLKEEDITLLFLITIFTTD